MYTLRRRIGMVILGMAFAAQWAWAWVQLEVRKIRQVADEIDAAVDEERWDGRDE